MKAGDTQRLSNVALVSVETRISGGRERCPIKIVSVLQKSPALLMDKHRLLNSEYLSVCCVSRRPSVVSLSK